MGLPCLLENVDEKMDLKLVSLLRQQALTGHAMRYSSIASRSKEEPLGRLYLMTKLHNPQFAPQVCSVVTMVDFSASREGLQEQLLQIMLDEKESEASDSWFSCMMDSATHKKSFKDLEDRVLQLMAESS